MRGGNDPLVTGAVPLNMMIVAGCASAATMQPAIIKAAIVRTIMSRTIG